MNQVLVVLLMCAVATLAYPTNYYDIIEDAEGQQYYLIPFDGEVKQHERVRRQTTSGSIGPGGVDISHTENILDNKNHRLDGTAFASKPFPGPTTAGGSLDYAHKPTGSGLSVGAQHTPHFGTDVSARGNYNFLNSRDGRTSAGVSGEYSRHFGGPFGNGRPNYGAFLNFQHRF